MKDANPFTFLLEQTFDAIAVDPKNALDYDEEVGFSSLDGAQIVSLLSRCADPYLVSLCDIGHLSEEDWGALVTAQPTMEQYRKRCEVIAPPGNAALVAVDFADQEEAVIHTR